MLSQGEQLSECAKSRTCGAFSKAGISQWRSRTGWRCCHLWTASELQGKSLLILDLSGAVICPACLRGARRPLALMKSADQVPLSPASTKLRQHLGFSWLRPRSDHHHPSCTLTVRSGGPGPLQSWSGHRWRVVDFVPRQHSPSDAGGLVGHGNGDDPGRSAFEKRSDPGRRRR